MIQLLVLMMFLSTSLAPPQTQIIQMKFDTENVTFARVSAESWRVSHTDETASGRVMSTADDGLWVIKNGAVTFPWEGESITLDIDKTYGIPSSVDWLTITSLEVESGEKGKDREKIEIARVGNKITITTPESYICPSFSFAWLIDGQLEDRRQALKQTVAKLFDAYKAKDAPAIWDLLSTGSKTIMQQRIGTKQKTLDLIKKDWFANRPISGDIAGIKIFQEAAKVELNIHYVDGTVKHKDLSWELEAGRWKLITQR